MNDLDKLEHDTKVCRSKKSYRSKAVARAAALRIKSEVPALKLVSYRCGVCRRWHLTKRRHRRSFRFLKGIR